MLLVDIWMQIYFFILKTAQIFGNFALMNLEIGLLTHPQDSNE